MATIVVNVKHEPCDVYIGRGRGSSVGIWGNPFTHLPEVVAKNPHLTLCESPAAAVALYRQWIAMQPALLARIGELKGKKLGCWCKPGPCHGDVLAELADALVFLDDQPSNPHISEENLGNVEGVTITPYNVIVCGSRNFGDCDDVNFKRNRWRLIQHVLKQLPPGCTIYHGAARGADAMAKYVAGKLGYPVIDVPAQWEDEQGHFDRGAGPKRNKKMYEMAQPKLVIAFASEYPISAGTRNMLGIAYRGGTQTATYYPTELLPMMTDD